MTEKKDDVGQIEKSIHMEITELDDLDLEEVAGGLVDSNTNCRYSCNTNCTVSCVPPAQK